MSCIVNRKLKEKMIQGYIPKLTWIIDKTESEVVRSARSLEGWYEIVQICSTPDFIGEAYYNGRKIGNWFDTIQEGKKICENHHFNKMLPYLKPVKINK